MVLSVKDAGAWKEAAPLVRDAGVWKEVQEGYVRQGGVWVPFYSAAPVAPEFIQGANAAATTISIPAHQADDLIIARVLREGTTNYATMPSGWTEIKRGLFNNSTTANDRSAIWAYRMATGPDTSFGTWMNATLVTAYVFRGPTGIGASAIRSGQTAIVLAGEPLVIPAIPTLQNPGFSYVVAISLYSWASAASGMTSLTGAFPTGNLITTEAAASFATRSAPANTNSVDLTCAFELLM